jgi:hypothetical protein
VSRCREAVDKCPVVPFAGEINESKARQIPDPTKLHSGCGRLRGRGSPPWCGGVSFPYGRRTSQRATRQGQRQLCRPTSRKIEAHQDWLLARVDAGDGEGSPLLAEQSFKASISVAWRF